MEFVKKLMGSIFSKVDDDSPRGKVNSTDIAKVLRGGLLVGLAAGVSHVLSGLEPDMFGQYEYLATIGLMVLSELSMRFLKHNEGE